MPQSDARTRRAALVVTCTASFLTPFMGSAVNVALPSLGRDFALNGVLLGWVPTAYLLAAAMFLLPFGRWADLRGRKRTFVLGLLVDGTASLLTGLAPSPGLLVAFRVLQGIGGAMIFGVGIALLTSVFPARERGRVLGINVATVYSGLAGGPFLGGLLTEHLGWRSVFLVGAPIAFGAAILTALYLRQEWASDEGEGFDWAGSVVYALSLAALIYGLSRLPGRPGVGLMAGGLVGLAAFAVWESRVAAPLLDVRLLARNRLFACSNAAALINYTSTAGTGFLLSLYLQYQQGLSPREAGTVLLLQPVVQALCSPFAGRLSDRIEPRIIASLGMGATAVGLASLILLGAHTSLIRVAGSLLVLGMGFGLFSSPNVNAIMSAVDRGLYGVASGMLATMRLTGQMLSMGLVMLMLAAHLGKAEITPERYGAFLQCAQASFALFAVLCTVGIFASLARGRVREPGDEEEG